jgi:hypothetical protein
LWPALTIEARNQDEVDCLLRVLTKAGHAVLVHDGFRVEVGGAHPAVILHAVQVCLDNDRIDFVSIALQDGRKATLSRKAVGG